MSLITLKEMADRTGLDRGTIHKALAKAGIIAKKLPMPTGRGVQDVLTVPRAAGEKLIKRIVARHEEAQKNAAAAGQS